LHLELAVVDVAVAHGAAVLMMVLLQMITVVVAKQLWTLVQK
jgi:hypothetical protein